MSKTIKNKINTSLFLSSYLDTLGFKNGEWEFNFNFKNNNNPLQANVIWLHIIHNFYVLGGLNIDISEWNSSDDTILSIATAEACLKGGSMDDYINSYSSYLELLEDPKRASGVNTINTLKKIMKLKNINKLQYNDSMGGNGAAIRTSPIGLIYFKENDLDKLIKQSIESSRITHNYTMGFLSGLVSALFTSYAIRDIPINEWCNLLIQLHESGKIENYMKTTNINNKFLEDQKDFWDKWYQYREKRLQNILKKEADKYLYPLDRIEDMRDYFPGTKYNNDLTNYNQWGASGIGAVIMAYDSLLLSMYFDKKTKKYELSLDSLIFFSTLHFGDNDSTGAIAGSWFGAYQGSEKYKELNDKFTQLEFYEKINRISEKISNL